MAYEQFAYVYDQLMAHAPYDEWVKFTTDVISKHQLNVHTIVDLGCGTGEITIPLKDIGYDITGVDMSEDMLVRANEKSIEKNIQIPWIQQDIRSLQGFHHIDLCISYCDVMNYITDKEDVARTFEQVFHCLHDKGTFIFDVHHLPYVQEKLINHTFSDVTEQMAYIWDCFGGDSEGEMHHHITFFKEIASKKYERFDEYHHQQTYAPTTYAALLKNIGFTKITIYADFQIDNCILENNNERIFIIAEK